MAKTKDGFDVNYSGGVVKVSKSGVPQDKFDDELSRAEEILSNFKMTKPGSTWGSDGIGYMVQKKAGHVIVNKSGVIPKWAKIGMEKINESVNEGALNEDQHDQEVAAKHLEQKAKEYLIHVKNFYGKGPKKDAGMLKFLSNDVKQMIDIVKLIRAGKWVAAADKADMMDTAARELIPDITWELLQKHGSDNEINDSVKTSLKNVIREELQSLNETQTYSVTLKITFGAGDRSDITDAINQIKDIDTVLDVKIVGMNKIKEGVEPIVEGSERFGINATILGEGNATRNMIMKTLDKWENLPGITEIRTSRIIGGGDRDHSINTKK